MTFNISLRFLCSGAIGSHRTKPHLHWVKNNHRPAAMEATRTATDCFFPDAQAISPNVSMRLYSCPFVPVRGQRTQTFACVLMGWMPPRIPCRAARLAHAWPSLRARHLWHSLWRTGRSCHLLGCHSQGSDGRPQTWGLRHKERLFKARVITEGLRFLDFISEVSQDEKLKYDVLHFRKGDLKGSLEALSFFSDDKISVHCEIQLGLMWFKQLATDRIHFPKYIVTYVSSEPKPLTISHRSASGSHAALSWLGDACQEYERWQSPAPWSQRTSRHTVLHLKMRVNEVSQCWNIRLGGSVAAHEKDSSNVLNNS